MPCKDSDGFCDLEEAQLFTSSTDVDEGVANVHSLWKLIGDLFYFPASLRQRVIKWNTAQKVLEERGRC